MVIGAAVGLIGPAALLYLFFVWKGTDSSLIEFYGTQYRARLLSPLLSLCAIANLGSFWLLLQRKQYVKVRGLILSTLAIAILIVFLKFGT